MKVVFDRRVRKATRFGGGRYLSVPPWYFEGRKFDRFRVIAMGDYLVYCPVDLGLQLEEHLFNIVLDSLESLADLDKRNREKILEALRILRGLRASESSLMRAEEGGVSATIGSQVPKVEGDQNGG